MATLLRARLAAVKVFLRSLDGKEGFSAASQTQSLALSQLIGEKRASMNVEDCASLQALAAAIPWSAEEHRGMVLTALVPEAPGPARARLAMQDYTHVLAYFTADEWSALRSSANSLAKRDVVLKKLAVLGCRAPSEPTLKLAASLWMCLTHAEADMHVLGPATKADLLKAFKVEWKRHVRRLERPKIPVEVLPADPEDFRHRYPSEWQIAFGGSAPAPTQVDLHALLAFDASYGCRGGPSSSDAAPVLNLGHGPEGFGGEALRAMASVAQSMMTQQTQILHLLGAGGSPPVGFGGGACAPLRSFSAIAGLQAPPMAAPLALQAVPPQPMDSPPSKLALSPAQAASPDSIGDSVPLGGDTTDLLRYASPALERETAPTFVALGGDSGASDSVADLLGRLEERDRQKRKEQNVRKKTAIHGPAALEDGPGECAKVRRTEPAEAEGEESDSGELSAASLAPSSKAQAKGKAKAKASAAPSKSAAKAKVKAAGKAKTKATTKEKATATTPGAAGAKAKAAASKTKNGPHYSFERSRKQVMCRTALHAWGRGVWPYTLYIFAFGSAMRSW